MKLLLWHCSSLRSRDIRKSSRPQGIQQQVGEPTSVEFEDVLLAFVCVEEGDDDQATAAGSEEILRLSAQIGRREVVVVPFAHLSNKLMRDSVQAQALIEELARNLGDRDLQVAINSFGFHKRFELHFVANGHPGSVAFRDIPSGAA